VLPVLLAALLVASTGRAQEPSGSTKAATERVAEPVPVKAATEQAKLLAEQLKRHPPRASKVEDPLRLFLLDREDGSVTLVADEPDPGSNHVGSPRWSHDGKRILYDAMPGTEYSKLRIKVLECGKDAPKLNDLGLGACPAWSPDDQRIAFLLNSSNEAVDQSGVWVMEADGSRRRRAGEYGIPLWSPDGRTFLIVSFGEPRDLKLIEVATGQIRTFELADGRVHSWPSWADADCIVAVVGSEQTSTAVALVNVGRPEPQPIREFLWRHSRRLDVKPSWPVYSAATRRCIFVGETLEGMALYEFEQGKPAETKRLEAGGLDQRIAGLSLSPCGRFLLFCSTRQLPPARK
jgi:hypothetical protein